MIGKLVRLAIFVVVLLVGFELGFEVVLRLIAFGVITVPDDSLFRAYYMNAEREIISYLPTCARYDQDLTYTLKPGECRFANREYGTHLQVNSMGLRDDEASLQAPEIIVLGDSHAMGWGVQQEDSFPQRLEQASGMKVLNAGVPSYGTARELLLLKRLDTSHLHYLVIQYCNNDDEENALFLRRGGKQVPMSVADYQQESATYRALLPYWPLKYLDYTFGEVQFLLGQWWEKHQGRLPASETVLSPDQAVERFLAVLAASGVNLPGVKIIVLDMNAVERRSWPFIPALQARLKSPGQDLPLMAKGFVAIAIPELADQHYYFNLDDHMNREGHERVAQALLAIVREE